MLLFDADGELIQRRRKITPTYHERMIWGQGDGSGLHAVDSRVGRIGQLACWEHYNPLARYAMIVAPQGSLLGAPIRSGEGVVIADLDFTLIDKRKHLMDSRGHYSRPELPSLLVDRSSTAHVHERANREEPRVERPEDPLAAVVRP